MPAPKPMIPIRPTPEINLKPSIAPIGAGAMSREEMERIRALLGPGEIA
jgi:hypothetical protein